MEPLGLKLRLKVALKSFNFSPSMGKTYLSVILRDGQGVYWFDRMRVIASCALFVLSTCETGEIVTFIILEPLTKQKQYKQISLRKHHEIWRFPFSPEFVRFVYYFVLRL